jgi:hypothetical protein
MKHVIFSNTLNHDDANMEGFAVRIVVSSGTFFFYIELSLQWHVARGKFGLLLCMNEIECTA